MNASNAFPADWLKVSDVESYQEEAKGLTISDVYMQPMGTDKAPRPAIAFHGFEKVLLPNRDNWKLLRDAFGDETDDWKGHKVNLSVGKSTYKDEVIKSIKVHPLK